MFLRLVLCALSVTAAVSVDSSTDLLAGKL